MHELAIAQELVRIACEHARRAGVGRVRRLNCRIGVLRQVEPGLLREAFEIARGDSACCDAELCVQTVPLRARCGACGQTFDVVLWNWACPRCGLDAELLPGGDELELLSIEAEDRP